MTNDISRLRKTVADQPITRDQFFEMYARILLCFIYLYVCMYVSACDVMIDKIDRREQELAAFLAERSIDWTLPNQSPVMVGAFSSAE